MDPEFPTDPIKGSIFSHIRDEIKGIYEDDFVIDRSQGLDDLQLRKDVNDALLSAFGYPFVMMLKTGLLALTQETMSDFNLHILTHDQYSFARFVNALHFVNLVNIHRGIYSDEASFRNINKRLTNIMPWLLSGHMESFDVKVIEQENVYINKDQEIATLVPTSSPLLTGIFNNLKVTIEHTYHSQLRDNFIDTFYLKFSSMEVQNKLLIEGKEILKTKIKKMLYDQITPKLIDVDRYFKAEIDQMLEVARNRGEIFTRSEMIEIRRQQLITFLSDIYILSLFKPGGPPDSRNPRLIGDFAQHLQDLLEDPYLLQKEVGWTTQGISSMNAFFREFTLKFSREYFSTSDIIKIVPSLHYKHFNIGTSYGKYSYGYDGINKLKDIKAIMPELKGEIDELIDVYTVYFTNYWKTTGNNKFTIHFYKETFHGIMGTKSYLKESLPDFILTRELYGDGLEFIINNEKDLKKMVVNMVYYMIKYDCIAAVKEISKNEQNLDNPYQKYALIASPSRILTNRYMRMAYDAEHYDSYEEISYFEMSEFTKSKENQEDLSNYDLLAELLKRSQEKLSKHSIYLLSNTEILREYLDFTYGDGIKMINDLGNVYARRLVDNY